MDNCKHNISKKLNSVSNVLILIPWHTFLLFVDQIEDKLDTIITMHCKIIGETDTIWYHWVFSMYTVKDINYVIHYHVEHVCKVQPCAW